VSGVGAGAGGNAGMVRMGRYMYRRYVQETPEPELELGVEVKPEAEVEVRWSLGVPLNHHGHGRGRRNGQGHGCNWPSQHGCLNRSGCRPGSTWRLH
jgi:hypothetical protein